MKDYIPLDPAHGELARQSDQESDDQRRRLEHELPERLRQVLLDTTESEAARGNALLLLLMSKNSKTQELLPELFEDPHIGHLAIQYCQPGTSKAVDRLRVLLDSPRLSTRIDAAIRLASVKDEVVRPYLLKWFHGEDQGQRNGAIHALKELDAKQALELLRERWQTKEQAGDEEDRMVLAETMLSLGDDRGRTLLESVARSGVGAWSCFAAFTIFWHDPALGCELLLHIIDDGDTEAKQSVVSQVWNFERNSNAINAEGINEARQWVEWQYKEHAAGRQVGVPRGISLDSDGNEMTGED